MSVSISSNSWSLSKLDAKNVNIMWNFKPIAAHRFHQKYISEWSESHDLVTHDRVHPWRGVHFRWKNHHFWVLIQGGGGLHDHFFINIKICHFDCHPYYDFNLTNGLDGHNFANLQWSLETIIMNIIFRVQATFGRNRGPGCRVWTLNWSVLMIFFIMTIYSHEAILSFHSQKLTLNQKYQSKWLPI